MGKNGALVRWRIFVGKTKHHLMMYKSLIKFCALCVVPLIITSLEVIIAE